MSRNLVTEQLAPATSTRAPRFIFAVGNRSRPANDVDTIVACQRSGPTTNHVITASELSFRQYVCDGAVQARKLTAVLAICRQPDEGELELRGGYAALLQCSLDTLCQQGLQSRQSDFEMVSGSGTVGGQYATRHVDQQEVCFRSSTVDAEEGFHRRGFHG